MGCHMRRANREEQLLVASLDRTLDLSGEEEPRIVVDIIAPPLMAPVKHPVEERTPLPDALVGWYFTG